MSRWKNFHIWRGRLPHWRAEDVAYYVTFRHKRPLDEGEMRELFKGLMRPEGRTWTFKILCILPEVTELILEMTDQSELSDILEKTKTKVSKRIQKKTGERYPVFYTESFDRIIRDEAEFEETFSRILDSPPVDDPEDWETLWVPHA